MRTFDCVHDGGPGSSKHLWHCKEDELLYAIGPRNGSGANPTLEPISQEVLERNGFTPSETLEILAGLASRKDNDVDVSAVLQQVSSMTDWLSKGTDHMVTEGCPLPPEVLLGLVH